MYDLEKVLKDVKVNGVSLETFKAVNEFTGIPIKDRDFNWYHDAAFKHKLSDTEMEVYDEIFNSQYEFKSFLKTEGFMAVDKHINKWGMNSEKAEYMWSVADLDTDILYEINEE